MDVFHFVSAFSTFLFQEGHASGDYGTTCPERTCEVQVTIDSGPLCGRILRAENSTNYYSFRGIPYAKPPLGRRRFQAPEPPEPWKEPLFATVEGPACPQRDILYGNLPIQIRGQSEDCLYLNVHVPISARLQSNGWSRRRQNKGLPVLVFIPGGGFHSGSGNSDLHGPEFLIRKDVIVVTMNYRIGLFGFLSLNTANVPGNAGLRDQVAALRWVKKNIKAFGGDPDNVTLMGQSAGSTITHLLSLSKATKGLFNRIIMMSGTGVPSYFSASRNYSNFINNLFFQEVGINSTDPEEIFQQLITMPLIKIMYATEKVQNVSGFAIFVPIVEDKFPGITRIIDAEPLDLVGKGRGKEYPTLVSFTTDEMEFFRFVFLIQNTLRRVDENPQLLVSPRLSFSLPAAEIARLAQRVKQRYFDGPPTMEALIKLYTDSFFKYPTFKLAEWRAALGGAPLYVHQFGYVSLFSVVKYGLWIDFDGTAHVEDLTYVFRSSAALGDRVSFPPKNRDDRMKDWMTDIVTCFMRTSNPACKNKNASLWPAVTKDNIWYQNTHTTKYDIMGLTEEQRGMVAFHDRIDSQSRALSEKLRN